MLPVFVLTVLVVGAAMVALSVGVILTGKFSHSGCGSHAAEGSESCGTCGCGRESSHAGERCDRHAELTGETR